MRNYIANPNYSDVTDSPYWSVIGTTTPDAALADVTQLSIGLVPDDGVNYKAAHVEDLSKLLLGSTSLSVASWGQRGGSSSGPLGNTVGAIGTNSGDPFIYVNDITQVQPGNTVALLEGTTGSHPISWTPAVSTDDFMSEWLKARNVGLVPVVSSMSCNTTAATFLPSSGTSLTASLKPLYNLDDYDNNRGQTGPEYAPTPDNVGATKTAGTQIPSFYITTSGDTQAQANVQTGLGLSDWNPNGYNVVSVAVSTAAATIVISGSTTFTNAAGVVKGMTGGQMVTLAIESTNMGWNAGTITGVTGSGSTWTITTDLTTFTTGAGSTGLGAVPYYWTLPATAMSSTSAVPTTVSVTATGSTGSNLISVSSSTANLDVGQMVTFASGVSPLICEIIGISGSKYIISGTASGTGTITGTAQNVVAFTATVEENDAVTGQPDLVLKNGVNIFGCEPLMAPYYATTYTDIYLDGQHGAPVGSHYGQDLYFPVQFSNYYSTPVANFQSMTALPKNAIPGWVPSLANGSTLAATGSTAFAAPTPYVVYADSVANIYPGQKLTFRSDFTPNTNVTNIIIGNGSGTANINAWNTGDIATSDVAYYQVLPGQQLLGLGGVIGSSVQTVAVGSSSSFTIYPNSTQDHATNAAPVRLTTRDKYLYSWQVYSVNTANNSFIIYNSSQSYTHQPGSYPNGDSQNAIYQYDPLVTSGAVFDLVISDTTGAGVVGLTSNVVGNHATGTFVAAYEEGPRYLGTSATGDLEAITPSFIGTRVGSVLDQNAPAGSTYIIVSPNPTTATGTFGAWNYNAYGNSGNGGFVPLANNGTTYTFTGNCYDGSTSITGITPTTGLAVGQEIAVASSQGSFPSGTEITAISKNTLTVSQAFVGPTGGISDIPNNTLTATANSLYTIVVGEGSDQELVTLVPPSNSISTSLGQPQDGSANINQPMIWYLANGLSLQNDHTVGEIVTTPNFTYSAGGSTTSHAQYTPVLGSPDLGTIYTVSGGTDYVQTNALVASNNSNQIAINAEVFLELDDPWEVSGLGGDPNISTALTSPSVAGDTQITIGDNGGFPTTLPNVLNASFSYQPPTLGLLNGAAAAGATYFTINLTSEVPASFPFTVAMGTGSATVGTMSLIATGSTGGTFIAQLQSTTINGFVLTSGNSVATVGSTAGISTGQVVTGNGIPSGTTVASIGAGSVTFSATASLTAQVALTFTNTLGASHPDMTPVILSTLPANVGYHKVEVPSFYLWKSDGSDAGFHLTNPSTNYTSINTTPLPCAIPANSTLYLRYGAYVDSFYTATGAAAGATGFAIQASSGSTAGYAPSSNFPTSIGSSGSLTTVGAVVTVGLTSDLEPEQEIFLTDGTNVVPITVSSYTPSISASIPTLQYSTTVDIAAGSTFIAPPNFAIDSGADLETVYPLTVPAAAGNNWSVQLAAGLTYNHNVGAPVSYYEWPSNIQTGMVTYRPDYGEFVMWDGERWRQARVNYVQTVLAILGAVGGRDQTNISLYDASTGVASTPDTFANTLSTAFTVYYGGARNNDPNGDEWTGDTLSAIQLQLKVQVPQSRQIAFRSLGLNVQYKSQPVVRQVSLTPTDNLRLDQNQHTSVSWLYTDLDNDQQAGWDVKIFADTTVVRDDFDPTTSTPFWSASGTDTSSEVALDASHGYTSGMRYWAYVRVAKKFRGSLWYSDWQFTPFVPNVKQPQPPLVMVYGDNNNAVNTVTIQSTDNLLAPDNGAFTNSLGTWTATHNDFIAGMLSSIATTSKVDETLGVVTSIPVGAVGYLKTQGALSGTGTGTFVVSGNTGGSADALGFPITGRFWVTIGTEQILVTNKVDGKNSGDTFQIVTRGYNGTTPTSHLAGSTVTFGLQQPVYTGSNLELSYTEKIVKDWTTTNTSVRWVGGSAGVTRTSTTASFDIVGHDNGEKNTAIIIDSPGITRDGWDGQQVTIQYPNPLNTTEAAVFGLYSKNPTITQTAIIRSVTQIMGATPPPVGIAMTILSDFITKGSYTVRAQVPNGSINGVPVCHNGTITTKTVMLNAGERVYIEMPAARAWTKKGFITQPAMTASGIITQPFYFGSTTIHMTVLLPSASGILPALSRIIYDYPEKPTAEKKVVFDRTIGMGAPISGGKILFSVTQTFGAVSATKVVTNTPVKHSTVSYVPHAQTCVVDYYTQPITATGTAGVWNGSTFATLSATLSGLSFTGNITSGSSGVTGVSSTAGLAVGQQIFGFGVLPNTYISAVGTGTISLSTTATTSATANIMASNPTFNAFQFASIPGSVAVGSTIVAPGLPNGSVVAGITGTVVTFTSNITDGYSQGAGSVSFSDIDQTTGVPKNPLITQTVSFITSSQTVIPAGSTTVPVCGFKPSGTFPAYSAVRINYPALYGDYAMAVIATTGGTAAYAEVTTHTAGQLLSDIQKGVFNPAAVPVKAGQTYALSAWTQVISSTAVPTFALYVDWYASNGTLLSTSDGTAFLTKNGNTTTSSVQPSVNAVGSSHGQGWRPNAIVAVAPANAYYAIPRIRWNNVTTGGVYGLSGIMFKAVASQALDLNGAAQTSNIGGSTSLPVLGSTVDPTNGTVASAINIPTTTPVSGYNTLFVFDPANDNNSREMVQGGSDSFIKTNLTATANAGDTTITVGKTLGMGVGALLYLNIGGSLYETVTIDPAWDGSMTVTISAPLTYTHGVNTSVSGYAAGLSTGVSKVQPKGGLVAALNWSYDGYVNQTIDTYAYNVQKSVDGGISWYTLRNGDYVVATGTGFASITDYEAVPGQATLYRALPSVLKNGGKTAVAGPVSAGSSPTTPMTSQTWWIADSSNPTRRYPINVQNGYTETQKHPSGVFYPLGSSRPYVVSGVVQGRDGDIKVIWTDLANWDNFLNLLNSGNVLILTNPVESTRSYIFINQDVQYTHNAAASPYREVEIQYVEAAPPGFGYSYGS